MDESPKQLIGTTRYEDPDKWKQEKSERIMNMFEMEFVISS